MCDCPSFQGSFAILALILVLLDRFVLGCLSHDLWLLMTLFTGDSTSLMLLDRRNLWRLHWISFVEYAVMVMFCFTLDPDELGEKVRGGGRGLCLISYGTAL